MVLSKEVVRVWKKENLGHILLRVLIDLHTNLIIVYGTVPFVLSIWVFGGGGVVSINNCYSCGGVPMHELCTYV